MKYRAISQVTLANMLLFVGCDSGESQPAVAANINNGGPDSVLAVEDEQEQSERVVETLRGLGFRGARWAKRGKEDFADIGSYQPDSDQEGQLEGLFSSSDDTNYSRRSSVIPRIECVEKNGRTVSAYWGYDNTTGDSVEIPIGWRNRFFPGASDNGQPTEFAPGLHEFAFSNEFAANKWLAWILDGKFRIAAAWTRKCGQNADIEPSVCVEELDNGDFKAHFSYDNKGDKTERVAIGPRNRVRPGPNDQGQPEIFLSGKQDDVFSVTFKKNRRKVWRLTGKRAVANKNTVRCEPVVDPCTNDNDCTNNDVCDGVETCDVQTGQCVDGTPLSCDDGNVCSGVETCDPTNGCQDGMPLDCEDNNDCTADSCDEANGCQNEPVADGTVCDNNGTPGVCESGTCIDTGCTSDIQCADENECTVDTCNEQRECVNDAAAANGNVCDMNGTPGTCSDGNCVGCTEDAQCQDDTVCNGIESCTNGMCVAGTPLTCDNSNVCDGTESCDPTNGCQDGTPLDCEDNNDCTADSCDEANGCQNEPVADGTVCDNDGSPGVCTSGVCGGECVSDSDCQDNNECTADSCVNNECVFEDVDDGTICDNNGENGVCQAGVCGSGCTIDADCDDTNDCTVDSCGDNFQCVNDPAPEGTDCDMNGTPGVCDDAGMCVGCTTDTQCQDDTVCNGQEACVENACISGNELICSNDNLCDGTETCDPVNGCQDGTPLDCEDNNECTADSCDEANGCVNEAVDNGTVCNANGESGICTEGVCNPVDCVQDSDCTDDGNECTTATCNDANECVSENVADGTSCADGVCTAGVCTPQEMVMLEHSGRGSFNSPFVVNNTGAPWKVVSGSYQVRHIGGFASESVPASRDYFSFSLNGVQGTVATAELHITHPGNSYDSADASETITLYDVSTSTADLETPNQGGGTPVLQAIFDDLGGGNSYGSFSADASDNGTVEIITLTGNANAMQDIQAAIDSGGDWTVGGSLTTPAATLPFGAFERVFRGSDASGGTPQPATKLVLTGVTNGGGTTTETIQAADVGYYLHGFNAGGTVQSFHWESPAGEHMSYFTGNQNLGGATDIERRPYYIFDAASITGTVESAKFRFWAWKPASANAGSGAYESVDASEEVVFRSVDNHTPEQIRDAEFNANTVHTVDVPIWEDLGDGDPLSNPRVHTVADETTDLIPSPTTNQSVNCADADVACGKWIEVDLNGLAREQIGDANGLWVMGSHMTTIGPVANSKEWINNGALSDLSPDKAPYPDFLTPLPELVVTYSN